METEEQQVERLKEFWNEHGKGIVIGAVLGFGLFYGWRYYDASVREAQEALSMQFTEVTESLTVETLAPAQEFAAANAGETYGQLAALDVAAVQVEAGELAAAVDTLQPVVANAVGPLKAMAEVRQARLLLALERFDEALAVLNSAKPESYKAIVAELRGDVLVAKGDVDAARAAYQEAITADPANAGRNAPATLKLQNLAVTS